MLRATVTVKVVARTRARKVAGFGARVTAGEDCGAGTFAVDLVVGETVVDGSQ